MRKFLPSKKFIFVIGGAIVLVLATFTATSFFGSKGVFQSKNKMVSVAGGDRTIGDIVSLDSNGNGIPDWEEKLWGLDPKGNGSENKKIIDDKKASANIDVTASPATELTETQKFSRELLTTVSALRVNGSLTPEVIGTLEQSLDIDLQNRKTNTPTYSADSFKTITNETPATYQKYHAQFKRIILRYQQNNKMGSEMDIITSGLQDTSSKDSLDGLNSISKSYINFAKEITSLDTPADAVPTVLALANVSDHLGRALAKVQTLYTDSMNGVVGLDEYVNDIDNFSSSSEDLASYFTSKDATQ